MRRKEGHLSHSFRPEEAIRIMAPTLRPAAPLAAELGILLPSSTAASSFFPLLPTAHIRVQPDAAPDPAGQGILKL